MVFCLNCSIMNKTDLKSIFFKWTIFSACIRRYNKNIVYNIEDMFASLQRECLGWNTSVGMACLSTAEAYTANEAPWHTFGNNALLKPGRTTVNHHLQARNVAREKNLNDRDQRSLKLLVKLNHNKINSITMFCSESKSISTPQCEENSHDSAE